MPELTVSGVKARARILDFAEFVIRKGCDPDVQEDLSCCDPIGIAFNEYSIIQSEKGREEQSFKDFLVFRYAKPSIWVRFPGLNEYDSMQTARSTNVKTYHLLYF